MYKNKYGYDSSFLTDDQIFSFIKELLDLNTSALLTGGWMLRARGIDIGRYPSDIDIITYGTQGLVFPEGRSAYVLNSSSGNGKKYNVSGIDIHVDQLISFDAPGISEKSSVVNGLRLGSVSGLVNAKLYYISNGSDLTGKHARDVEVLDKMLLNN